jgi:hypothetical protein
MSGILSSRPQAAQKPYEHQPYPSVRYHRSGKTQEVASDDEHEALMQEGDWADTPAAFAPETEAAAAKKSSKKKD